MFRRLHAGIDPSPPSALEWGARGDSRYMGGSGPSDVDSSRDEALHLKKISPYINERTMSWLRSIGPPLVNVQIQLVAGTPPAAC